MLSFKEICYFDQKFQNMGSLGDTFLIFDQRLKKKYGAFGWHSIILRDLWVMSELKRVLRAVHSVPSNMGVPPRDSTMQYRNIAIKIIRNLKLVLKLYK